MYQYEKNIPSDGQIDRLQIVNYPRGVESYVTMLIQDKIKE